MACDNIVFAYIFGSYAQGKARADSDIDIAIYLAEAIEIETYLEIKMLLAEVCKREVDLHSRLEYSHTIDTSGDNWGSLLAYF